MAIFVASSPANDGAAAVSKIAFALPATFARQDDPSGCQDIILSLRANGSFVERKSARRLIFEDIGGWWHTERAGTRLVLEHTRDTFDVSSDGKGLAGGRRTSNSPCPPLQRLPVIVEMRGGLTSLGDFERDVWTLDSLGGKSLTSAEARRAPTIVFDRDFLKGGTVSGSTGCNALAGTFVKDLKKPIPFDSTTPISFDVRTEHAAPCGAPYDDFERRLLAAFAKTRAMQMCCWGIHLEDATGHSLASFHSTRF